MGALLGCRRRWIENVQPCQHAPHTHPTIPSTACLLSPLPLHPLHCSARKAANANASSATCERAEMACEEVLDREARQHLPSSGRFKVGGRRGELMAGWVV